MTDTSIKAFREFIKTYVAKSNDTYDVDTIDTITDAILSGMDAESFNLLDQIGAKLVVQFDNDYAWCECCGQPKKQSDMRLMEDGPLWLCNDCIDKLWQDERRRRRSNDSI